MQKINPAQAASLEQDCKNSHFPTLPSMMHSFESLSLTSSTSYHFDPSPPPQSPNYNMPSPTLSSPLSSPSKTPRVDPPPHPPPPPHHHLATTATQPPPLPPHHHHHLAHRNNNNSARSSSFTSTGSASTYEEEEDEEMYQAERARRVGGIRGIRGEGENFSYTFTGGAGSRAGVRGLSALNVHSLSHPHLLSHHHVSPPPPPPPSHMRMAHSLPHGLDSQSLYSPSNQREFSALRSHSGASERSAVYDLNGNSIGSTLSLPSALPSHHWTSHQLYPQHHHQSESPVMTDGSLSSSSAADNIFTRNLSQYAGIPISSRQLKSFEMQQQRYLRDQYHHHVSSAHSGGGVDNGSGGGSGEYYDPNHVSVDSILSQLETVPEILINDIQINIGEEATPSAYYASPPPLPNRPLSNGGAGAPSSTRRSFTNAPLDIKIETDSTY
jgi:hypothetical protein